MVLINLFFISLGVYAIHIHAKAFQMYDRVMILLWCVSTSVHLVSVLRTLGIL